MRIHLRQASQIACFAVLGVVLTISLIGYLCAENVASPGFAAQETTIQRLPPVESEAQVPTYPPYGASFENLGYDILEYGSSYAAPGYSAASSQVGGPSLNPPAVAPSPVPETSNSEPPNIADEPANSGGESVDKPIPESEEDNQDSELEEIDSRTSTGPLGLITVDEEYAWVNEVRPDSLLVRMTRYLSRYVEDWDGSVQLGLDGTSGSSETTNIAFGVNGKRKYRLATFQFDVDYKRNTSEGVITADRLFFNCRYEHQFCHERWSLFAQDEVTYDEFQPWDVQVAFSSGVGHYFWKEDVFELQALCGGGFSQDIGGVEEDQECVPEIHFGLNGKHQINKRQKLIGSCDYYPDASDFNNSRIVGKLSWEVLLDEEVNLSMKFNITDRLYCPNPGGKENDLDYAVLLMWQF